MWLNCEFSIFWLLSKYRLRSWLLQSLGSWRRKDSIFQFTFFSFYFFPRCHISLLRIGAFVLGHLFYCECICSHCSSQASCIQTSNQNSLYPISAMLGGACGHCRRLSSSRSSWIHVPIRGSPCCWSKQHSKCLLFRHASQAGHPGVVSLSALGYCMASQKGNKFSLSVELELEKFSNDCRK